jgi:hypothetical protein
MKTSFLENDYAEYWIENGVMCYSYKPHIKKVTLDIARQMVKDRLKLSAGKTYPLFANLSNMVDVDKDARKYFSEGDALKHMSVGAILVSNPAAKYLANIFLRFDKPPLPAKCFTQKQQAFNWLEQFKQELQ